MKYELKITVDTENVDFLTKTLAKYCHDCVKNDVFCFFADNCDSYSEFECPFSHKGCIEVTPEDWKKVLKPLDNDTKQSYISLIKTHTAKFAING